MNAEIKNRWAAALLSGNYKQGQGSLRVCDNFCCLGVLCDVIDPNGWAKPHLEYSYRGCTGAPPQRILDEIGLESMEVQSLVDMNDREGLSFKQIAYYVETYL